jgi:hypothetical protein
MLADIAFRIVSRLMNLTPMCDMLTIELGFGTALAKRMVIKRAIGMAYKFQTSPSLRMPPSRQATARPARIDDSYPPDETLGNQLPKDEYGGSQ